MSIKQAYCIHLVFECVDHYTVKCQLINWSWVANNSILIHYSQCVCILIQQSIPTHQCCALSALHLHTNTHTCTHTYTDTCTHRDTNTYTHRHTHTHTNIYTQTHTHNIIDKHIHTHTHTHKQIHISPTLLPSQKHYSGHTSSLHNTNWSTPYKQNTSANTNNQSLSMSPLHSLLPNCAKIPIVLTQAGEEGESAPPMLTKISRSHMHIQRIIRI